MTGMRAVRVAGSKLSAMRVTAPSRTPRNVTGAPTSSPATEPSKKMTARDVVANKREPPNRITAAAARASAPRTKPPTIAGLAATSALVREPRPVHERANGRVTAAVAQPRGRAMCDRGLRLRVQEHTVVADGEQARQF